MKKFFTLSLFSLATLCAATAFAQPLANGYYRIQNYGSNRHAFICDNTGSINLTDITVDAGAIELWRDRAYVSDPASIVYVNYEGTTQYKAGSGTYNVECYDIASQGTSIEQILNNDAVSVCLKATGSNYYIYGAGVKAGVYQEKFLDDDKNIGPSDPNHDRYPDYNRGRMGTNNSGKYQQWRCLPISATGNEYFGFSPKVQAGGKYYQPFYASFPFSCYSSGMKVYTVTKVDKAKGIAVIKEAVGNIPGGSPVIVETSAADPSVNRISLLDPTTSGSLGNNALRGVYFNNEERNNRKAYDARTMRLLKANAQGQLVFAQTSVDYLPANESYLVVDADAPAELKVMTEEEYNQLPQDVYVTSVTLNETAKTLTEGDTFQLTAVVSPENATDASLVWTSSNLDVVSVDAQGLVSALKPGAATVTATAADGSGVSASCQITVEAKYVFVASVTLNETAKTLTEGDTFQLVATVAPDNATDATLVWSSSDDAVAKVSATGLVTAVSAGAAAITATATDGSGVSASCLFTIEPLAGLDSIVLDAFVSDVYTLSGIKVRTAGQSLANLAPGFYIVGGQKVIIR